MTEDDQGAADLISTGVKEVIDRAAALGLIWNLKQATVQMMSDGLHVAALYDGDETAIIMTSMIGTLAPDTRVYALTIPPSGNFIVGYSLAEVGYRQIDTVEYSSDDTFTYTTFKGVRAALIKVQAGGGAGGGSAATATGTSSMGGGGGGGGYAEKFATIAEMTPSLAITVGPGGTGVSGAAGNNGTASSAGALASATGGTGGGHRPSSSVAFGIGGANAGIGTIGDRLIPGGPGGTGWGDGNFGISGAGGDSVLGGGGIGSRTQSAGQSIVGAPGRGRGGGGSGANTAGNTGTAQVGGDGADGIVILDLYI